MFGRSFAMRFGMLAVFTTALMAGSVIASDSSRFDWAFPGEGKGESPSANAAGIVSLAGSRITYKRSVLDDGFLAIDWWPATHPAMPASVRVGRQPNAMACGYCHLPDGHGRPENAPLAGLPAAYIIAQVADMKSGARREERSGWAPIAYMHLTARAASRDEVAQAAAYYAHVRFSSHIHVIEAEAIPAVVPDAFVYRRHGGATEKLGERIVETPDDFERFTKRDSSTTYTAYVPPGALARGGALATSGDDGRTSSCVACHAFGLRGSTVIPPLAGRSPTMLFRQLEAFRSGTRHAAADLPMRAEAVQLSSSEMIDVAAYAASLTP